MHAHNSAHIRASHESIGGSDGGLHRNVCADTTNTSRRKFKCAIIFAASDTRSHRGWGIINEVLNDLRTAR